MVSRFKSAKPCCEPCSAMSSITPRTRVSCFRQSSIRIRSASLDAKKSSTGFWSLSGSRTELLCQLRGMAGAPLIQMIRQIVSSSNVSKLAKLQPTPSRLGLNVLRRLRSMSGQRTLHRSAPDLKQRRARSTARLTSPQSPGQTDGLSRHDSFASEKRNRLSIRTNGAVGPGPCVGDFRSGEHPG
jgi:hypothetical protein